MSEGKQFKSSLAYGVTLWGNLSDAGHPNFSIKKSYKDDTGEYKESKVFFPQDLAALVQLLPQAISWADEQRSKSRTIEKHKNSVEDSAPKSEVAATSDDIPF